MHAAEHRSSGWRDYIHTDGVKYHLLGAAGKVEIATRGLVFQSCNSHSCVISQGSVLTYCKLCPVESHVILKRINPEPKLICVFWGWGGVCLFFSSRKKTPTFSVLVPYLGAGFLLSGNKFTQSNDERSIL